MKLIVIRVSQNTFVIPNTPSLLYSLVITVFLRHSCESRNPVVEFVILHSVAGCRKVLWIGYYVAASSNYSGSVCIPTLERGNEGIIDPKLPIILSSVIIMLTKNPCSGQARLTIDVSADALDELKIQAIVQPLLKRKIYTRSHALV